MFWSKGCKNKYLWWLPGPFHMRQLAWTQWAFLSLFPNMLPVLYMMAVIPSQSMSEDHDQRMTEWKGRRNLGPSGLCGIRLPHHPSEMFTSFSLRDKLTSSLFIDSSDSSVKPLLGYLGINAYITQKCEQFSLSSLPMMKSTWGQNFFIHCWI